MLHRYSQWPAIYNALKIFKLNKDHGSREEFSVYTYKFINLQKHSHVNTFSVISINFFLKFRIHAGPVKKQVINTLQTEMKQGRQVYFTVLF